MKKIILTGPESSGKTTMAADLAAHFGAEWLPEFARQYLGDLGRGYQQSDLLKIAQGQLALEDELASRSAGFCFLDTSLEVIKIWSEIRFGQCDPWILEKMQARKGDFYLLCQPDLPWAFDPLRENPDDRWMLFDLYRHELRALAVDFAELNGHGTDRLHQAISLVERFLAR